MKKTAGNLFIIAAFAAVLAFAGCSGSDSETTHFEGDGEVEETESTETGEIEVAENVAAAIEQVNLGKEWLEKGQCSMARQCFEKAVEYDPANLDGHFGLAFSESQQSFEIFMSLLTMVMKTKQPDWASSTVAAGGGEPEEYESQSDYLSKLFAKTFKTMADSFERSVAEYDVIKKSADASKYVWHISKEIPVYMGTEKMAWMKGDARLPEIYMFDSLSRMLGSVFHFLSSINIHGDVAQIVNEIQGGGSLSLNAILPMVVDVLNGDENFLGFAGGAAGGKSLGAEMIKLWSGALDDVVKAAEFLQAEGCVGGSGEADEKAIFYCVDDSYNGTKTLEFKVFKLDKANGDLATGEFLMNVVAADLTKLPLYGELKSNLEKGGAALDFRAKLSPVFSGLLSLAAGYRLIDFLGFDLGLGDAITPKVIENLLKLVIPAGAGMDFGTYFADPIPLRKILPQWTSDQPKGKNKLWMEWECPSETADDGMPDGKGTFLCKASKECSGGAADACLLDAAHFAGTPQEQPADGIALGSPYFVWQDPTIGGLLYINPCDISLSSETCGLAKGTQQTVNVFMGKLIKGILSFAGSKK